MIGEVVKPGRFEWSNEMSLLDLIAHTGGPTSRADTSTIEVLSPQPDGSTLLTVFNLDKFMKTGQPESALPKVYAGATVRVHDLPVDPTDNKSQWVRQASEKSIYIFGQVGAPGDINLMMICIFWIYWPRLMDRLIKPIYIILE